MRICIDATPLLLRSAGVKNYIYHWMVSLQRQGGGHSIDPFPFFCPFGELNHERSQVGISRTVAGIGLLHFANYSGVPVLDLLGHRYDVFHASHQLLRPPRNTKLTATIYDMTCWLMPHMHSVANVSAGKRFADLVLKRADGLIAISESTRCDAINMLGLDPARVTVIYPGVPEVFFETTPDSGRTVRERYSLVRPYVLFVGTIEPRKNITVLLDAYEQLARSVREEFDLVLAGPVGWADQATLRRLHSPTAGVRYLGYVPESDLPGLTAGASVLAYPSLYEGFGFPVAQAMAAGVPVVTSNISSLPEVAGDGGITVDPRSVQELRDALQKVLLSPRLRAALAENARRRAKLYSWTECARKSFEYFEAVT